MAELVIPEVAAEDLAWEDENNLWVAADGKILHYDFLHSTDLTATDVVTIRDHDDTRDLGVTGLAFDNTDELWGFDFGSNTIFSVIPEFDGGEQTVSARRSYVISVDVLVDRGAFDASYDLWLSYGTHGLARFKHDSFGSSSATPLEPSDIVTSDDLDSELRLAFFPAAYDLPLYHRLVE